MNVLLNWNNVIPIISIILCLGVSTFAYIRCDKGILLCSFLFFELLICLWTIRIIIQNTNIDTENTLFIIFKYISNCFISVSLLVFSLVYTENKIVKNKMYLFLFIFPAAFYLSVCTNNIHHSFFKEDSLGNKTPGIFYILHTLESYCYFFIGIINFFIYSKSQFNVAKKQSQLLFVGVTIILFSNIMGIIVDSILSTEISYVTTPVGIAIASFFFGYCIIQYRFSNVMPIAINVVFDNMKDGVLVVDNSNRIVGWNKPLEKIGIENIHKYKNIYELINDLNTKKEDLKKISEILKFITYQTGNINNIELKLNNKKRYYNISVESILSKNDLEIGKIITFNDISVYKYLLNKLNRKNEELENIYNETLIINKKLSDYANISEELAIVKERSRISHDLHDTLGHTLILINSLLKMSVILFKSDYDEAIQKISQAISITSQGINEVRTYITGAVNYVKKSQDIIKIIEELISTFIITGIKVELLTSEKQILLDSEYVNVLYKICQEALTNSLRHGRATEVSIIIRYYEDVIELYIIDNGIGCNDSNIKKGLGLTGMKKRIEELNGFFNCYSNDEIGFSIHIKINIKRVEKND